jgi:glycosyltransferase involved in cell wall biosynthesis
MSIFKEEVIKSYHSRNIHINDFISNDKKMYTISEASCLIIPSHNEGQPQIILEAMFLGTPVIATSVGDIPTMLGNDYPFLCEVNSPESLSNTIEKFLMLNDHEKLKLSLMLKNRFDKYYSYDTHKTLLLSAFL